MSTEAKFLELALTPPRGPIAAKYNLFRFAGEPGWGSFDEIWAIGDVGTGKTSAMIDAIAISLMHYPRTRVAVVRSTLEELKDSLIPDLLNRLEPLIQAGYLTYFKDEALLQASNGSQAHFFGLDTAGNKLWGQQWFRAFVDQGERVKPEYLDLLHTRVRLQSRHMNGQPGRTYVKIAANWDRGRDWVFRRTRDGANQVDAAGDIWIKRVKDRIAGKEVEATVLTIYSRTTENAELTDEYYRHLLLGGVLGKRATAGGYEGAKDHLVFPEYTHQNLYNWLPDLSDAPIYIGLDHGVHHPTVAVFFARDIDGRLYAVREYARRNASAAQNAEAIVDIILGLSAQGASRFHIYADPSMWQRQAVSAQLSSVADIYLDAIRSIDVPVYFTPAYGRKAEVKTSRGSVEYGISAIKQFLVNRMLFVNPQTTPNLDRMLGELTYDHIQSDAMTLVDFFDAARYALTNVRMEDDDDNDLYKVVANPITLLRRT